MNKPLTMAPQSGSRPPGHEPGRETLRERAATLRGEGLTLREIAGLLGRDRSTIGRWLRTPPRCPGCDRAMSGQGKLCCRCSATARREPAAERLGARLAASVTASEAAEFATLVAAEGTTISAELRSYVRRRIAGATAQGRVDP